MEETPWLLAILSSIFTFLFNNVLCNKHIIIAIIAILLLFGIRSYFSESELSLYTYGEVLLSTAAASFIYSIL